MEFDILVRGGLLVDGSGDPPVPGDVGIQGETIAAVGKLENAEAGRVINAEGLAVAPGFIDVHVHSELMRLGGRDQMAGIKQGVTTELMSPDGFSWAPLTPPRSREVREYLQVFYGAPPRTWEWPRVKDYLAIFPGRLPGNLVPQVPHLPIKVATMGWETRPATGNEIGKMQGLVEEWLEAGAVSLAAGLEYQPGAFSSVEELVALCSLAAKRSGVYAPHQRGYWSRLQQGCGETFRVGQETGIRVHISHLAIDDTAERLINDALAQGIDVSFDMYPYSAACTHLMMMLPEWAQAGGHAAALARVRNPQQRALLRSGTEVRVTERGEIILSYVEDGEEFEGRTLHELAQAVGLMDIDYMLDLLSEHEGRALAIYHWPASIHGEEVVRRTLTHPLYIGSSDGIFQGSYPHRRGYGAFPRIVGNYVRDGTLRLEQAVHKVTGRPAERFHIRDRGLLKPQLAADIVIFDPETIADGTTWSDTRGTPLGIQHVLVNGVSVCERGEPTGKLPGHLLQ